jgi:hypothetical protein
LSEGADKKGSSSPKISEVNILSRVAAYQEHTRRFGQFSDNFMPIFINGELLCLDKAASVKDKVLLDAITKGIPIETNGMIDQERMTGHIQVQEGN